MWHASSDKELVIKGKYKKLFLKGVYHALDVWVLDGDDALEEGGQISTNDFCSKPYSDLSNREKLWCLAEVTRCLTTKCEPPKLLQWNESVVYAVFEVIQTLVTYEIDMQSTNEQMIEDEEIEIDTHEWRKLVSKVQRKVVDLDSEDYIDPDSDDIDEWIEVITEDLAGVILWDDDFLQCNANMVCDKSPENAKMAKYMLGIADEYYSTPVPHVTDKMLHQAKKFLNKTFDRLYGTKKK